MKGYIYCLWDKNENDIFYIGATVNPKNRLIGHRSSNIEYYINENNNYSSRKKDRNVNMSIIDEIEFKERKELGAVEDYWIHQFMAWGFTLQNVIYKGYSWTNNRKRNLKRLGFDMVDGILIKINEP